MQQQAAFQIALLRFGCQRQEIKIVRVFDELPGEIGLRRWKSGLKICDRLSLPFVESALYLQHEDVSAPAVLDRRMGVPEPFLRCLELLQQRQIVISGQLCKRHLHN